VTLSTRSHRRRLRAAAALDRGRTERAGLCTDLTVGLPRGEIAEVASRVICFAPRDRAVAVGSYSFDGDRAVSVGAHDRARAVPAPEGFPWTRREVILLSFCLGKLPPWTPGPRDALSASPVTSCGVQLRVGGRVGFGDGRHWPGAPGNVSGSGGFATVRKTSGSAR
jgi:hypothetical protein